MSNNLSESNSSIRAEINKLKHTKYKFKEILVDIYGEGANLFTFSEYADKLKEINDNLIKLLNRDLDVITLPQITNVSKNAFKENETLLEITLPNALSIEVSAFEKCTNLKQLNIPKVEEIEDRALYNCSSLTSLDLPSVKTLGKHSLCDCSNITNINTPELINIGVGAFDDCSSLTSLDLPNVEEIGNSAFVGCVNLTTVSLPKVLHIGDGAFKAKTTAHEILPNKITSIQLPLVTCIEQDAFKNCSNLNSIECANVETIKSGAFENCSSLTEINLPNATTVHGDAFLGAGITNLTLPALEEELCAFTDNQVLQSIDAQLVKYANYGCFKNCTNLKTVNLPNLQTLEERVFENCNSLENIDLSSVTSINNYTFKNCTNLKSVSIENASTILQYAFENCTSLENLIIPNVKYINNYAFKNCIGLTSVAIKGYGSNVSSNCFYGCSNLKVIDIQETSYFILPDIQCNCNSLTTIVIRNIPIGWSYVMLSGFDNISSREGDILNCCIYVPDNVLDNTKSKYSSIAERIKSLSELPTEE